jgi:predicted lipoprotein with Yx(FWY)xxD motif
MSLYEVLAVVVLVGAGGFAWYLYRKDSTADPATRAKQAVTSQPMFARDRGKPDGKS